MMRVLTGCSERDRGILDMCSVSVVIPSSDGSRGGNVPELLNDLSKQTIQPLDVHIVKGVSPVGRARNEGIERTNGDIVISLDDDVRLGHNRVLEYMIEPLCHDTAIGITGASIQIPEDSSWFQKASARQIERTEFRIVEEMVESDMVTTACCAIPRRIFDELGDFNDILLRGEDPEFRDRIRRAGYKIVIVPHSWFYHPVPGTFSQLMKMAFRNGRASAYGQRVRPDLVFETPEKHVGGTVKTHHLAIRTLRFVWRVTKSLVTFQWIQVSANIVYFTGYAWELVGASFCS